MIEMMAGASSGPAVLTDHERATPGGAASVWVPVDGILFIEHPRDNVIISGRVRAPLDFIVIPTICLVNKILHSR